MKVFIRFIYFCIFVGVLLFYVLYREPLSAVVLIFISVMPIVMLLTLFLQKIFFKASLYESSIEGKGLNLRLELINKFFLPLCYVRAGVSCHNHFCSFSDKKQIHLPIVTHGKARHAIAVSSISCGKISVILEHVYFEDPLRLFTVKKRINSTVLSTVFPEARTLDLLTAIDVDIENIGDQFSLISPGDDPSEVFDVRAYRAGDRLSRVHWKQSSRHPDDPLVIKELSCPLEDSVLIILEFAALTAPYFLNTVNALADYTLTLCRQLAMQDIIHEVVLFCEYGVTRQTVSTLLECNNILAECMLSLKPQEKPSFAALDTFLSEISATPPGKTFYITAYPFEKSDSAAYNSFSGLDMYVGDFTVLWVTDLPQEKASEVFTPLSHLAHMHPVPIDNISTNSDDLNNALL